MIIIDVYADVLCGWALVGRQRLMAAIQLADVPVTMRWRPYLIDPTAPQWSTSLTSVLTDPGIVAELDRCGPDQKDRDDPELGRFEIVAAWLGIGGGDPGAIGARWRASSWAAHRLITAAGQRDPELQTQVVDELLTAHFVDGQDLNALDWLDGFADRHGLARPVGDRDLNAGLVYLQPGVDPEEPIERATREGLLTGRAIGVATSPTFVINGRVAVAGAQSSQTLAAAIRSAPPQPRSWPWPRR